MISEGVETKGEMETLINLGVDYMQGYYISKPSFIPEDISDKIKKSSRYVMKIGMMWFNRGKIKFIFMNF